MSLLNLTPAAFCDATKACSVGRDWALTQPTMADLWDNCPRPDWLLWIADTIGQRPDDRTLRLFAIWCAENTPLFAGGKTKDLLADPRSLSAIEAAERFADGQATSDELATTWAAARYAVLAAHRADAWEAAGDAAWAATWAVELAAEQVAAGYAAGAAQAAHFRTLVPNPFRKEAQP